MDPITLDHVREKSAIDNMEWHGKVSPDDRSHLDSGLSTNAVRKETRTDGTEP